MRAQHQLGAGARLLDQLAKGDPCGMVVLDDFSVKALEKALAEATREAPGATPDARPENKTH